MVLFHDHESIRYYISTSRGKQNNPIVSFPRLGELSVKLYLLSDANGKSIDDAIFHELLISSLTFYLSISFSQPTYHKRLRMNVIMKESDQEKGFGRTT